MIKPNPLEKEIAEWDVKNEKQRTDKYDPKI